MIEYTIAPMKPEQAAAAAALEKECFSTPTPEKMLMEEIIKPEAIYFAATQGENLIGYVGMQSVLDEGYMMDICVAESCRRQGVGRALMQALLEGAERAALAFVTLEVRASNDPAIALYTALGFEKVGERKNYYQNPTENALLLTKFYRKEGNK